MNAIVTTPQIEIEMPESCRKLPVARGFMVPWFVTWIDGAPEFRAMDINKMRLAIRQRRCWICGDVMKGINNPFVVGPMCIVNRISAEPPNHVECARYAAMVCPFLSRPHMIRRSTDDIKQEIHMSEAGHPRNPSACVLYFTRGWQLMHTPREMGGAGVLFEMGAAVGTEWYANGRRATRTEARNAFESGIEILRAEAKQEMVFDPTAGRALEDRITRARALLPKV